MLSDEHWPPGLAPLFPVQGALQLQVLEVQLAKFWPVDVGEDGHKPLVNVLR